MTIVVIAEDPATRIRVAIIAEQRGHASAAFATSTDAWVYLQTCHDEQQLIVVALSAMDNLAFCQHVRQAPWGADLVLILLTPHMSLDDVTAALDAGADDVVSASADQALLEVRLAVAVTALSRRHMRPVAARRDRTARKQAEEASARLAAIVTSSDDAIIGKTLEGLITSWNQGATRLYGYTAEEAVGQSISFLVPPDRPDEVLQILGRLHMGEQIAHFETVRVRKDGQKIDVALTLSPIKDAHGQIIGASTIAQDISARRTMEEDRERLLAREQELRSLAERRLERQERLQHLTTALTEARSMEEVGQAVVAQGLAVFDAVGGTVLLLTDNNMMLRLLAIGGPVSRDVSLPRSMPLASLPIIAEALRRRDLILLETPAEMAAADSETAAQRVAMGIAAAGVLPLHAGDQVIGALNLAFSKPCQFTAEDRTFFLLLGDLCGQALERTRLFEGLRASEERYRRIVETATESIWIVDAQVIVTFVNQQCADLLGYTVQEMVGTSMLRYIAPEDESIAHDTVARLGQGGNEHLEIRLRRKDGVIVWVLAAARPILDAQGQYSGALTMAMDITQRKHAEESQAHLVAIVDASSDAIIGATLDGTVTNWTTGAERLYGYTAEEAIGHFLPLSDVPGTADATAMLRAAVRRGETISDFETVHRCKDGRLVPVSLSLATMRNTAGVMSGMAVISRDITARKQAETALREQAALLDLSRDAILLHRYPEGPLSFWNSGAEALYGWTRAEAVGRIERDLLGTRFPLPLEAIQATLDREGYWEGELHHTTRAGHDLVVQSRWALQRDEHGHPVALLTTNTDLTAYRTVEERFRATFEQAAVGMALATLEGDFLLVNDRLCALLGDSRDNLLAASWVDIIRLDNDAPGEDAVARLRADPTAVITLDKPYGLKDGTTIWAHLTLSIVRDAEGKPGQMIAVMEDITARKAAEDKVRWLNADLERRVAQRTSQLEVINKELEAFSYSVSHDLRAPVRAIAGFSRILGEDYGEHLPADAQHYLGLIHKNVVRMNDLIQALLALSRLNRLALQTRTVSPADIVRAALEELNAEMEGRNVEIMVNDLPACEADPVLLQQVFTNLLSNALKFTRTREVARITVGSHEQDGLHVYVVKDNGAGFDMRYATQLFGVFQRLHSTDDFEGTGIGLATVQRIVNRHGGRIWAEAAVDQGATFSFTLSTTRQQVQDT